MRINLALEDGKEYAFNAVPIGYWRKHDELMVSTEPNSKTEAIVMLALASLKKSHPEVTQDELEMSLLTPENFTAVYNTTREASGMKQGEIQPATS